MEPLEDRLAPASISALASFNPYPNGANPYGVIRDGSGDLYGTTNTGGAYGYGTVFEVKAGSSTVTTLGSFDFTNTGAYPASTLVRDSLGDLFGTTTYGGAGGEGTVFEIKAGSMTITPLHAFSALNGTTNADGAKPSGTLALDSTGSNLFGTTTAGGTYGEGTIYKVAIAGPTLTTLAAFNNNASTSTGSIPTGVVLDSHGNLFGAAQGGGANNYGTIFELKNNGGSYGSTITVLYAFTGASDGAIPNAVTLDSQGNLFGTTTGQSSNGTVYGTVFKLAKNSGGNYTTTPTTLHSFTNSTDGGLYPISDGAFPTADLLVDGSGNIFGTTSAGSTNRDGTVFELVNSGGTYTFSPRAAFAASGDGTNQLGYNYYPYGALVEDSQGNLYGTNNSTALDTAGMVFELPAGSSTFASIATFTNPNGGGALPNTLVRDSQGNLFGTTTGGGANGYGTVFEVPAGTTTIQVLYSFTGGSNGANPNDLIVGGNGVLYGTTDHIGSGQYGTVFKLTLSGGTWQYQPLHVFNGTDGKQPDSLLRDSAGNLFGITHTGGTYGYGTAFELAYSAGNYNFEPIYPFGTGGWYPANLVQKGNGDFYGTTVGTTTGGTYTGGTVFELKKSSGGVYLETDLASFTSNPYGPNSSNPNRMPFGPLALGSGGNLVFGTTNAGGSNNLGSVLELTSTDTLKSYSFTGGTDGKVPNGGVIRDNAGDLFGTTSAGGTNGGGTAFEFVNNSGNYTFTTIAAFGGLNGSAPAGGLAEDSTGNFYTVTVNGGAYGEGTVSEINDGLTISGPTLPVGTVNDSYNQGTAFSASGGSGWGYTLSASGLPGGLSFNQATDTITGTPTQSGLYTVTITAKDSAGHTVQKAYSLTVHPALTISSPASLPVATVNNLTLYSQQLTPSGGSGSGYNLTVSGLPNGLTFSSSNNTISGTPTASGSFTVTVGITDSIGATGSQNFTLKVNPALTVTPTSGTAIVGVNYSQGLTPSGGSGSGYSLSVPSPPGWLSFNSSTDTVSGTPSTSGTYPFTITIRDSNGATGSQTFNLTVNPPLSFSPSPANLPAAALNGPYAVSLSAIGGSRTGYSYAISGQPSWLKLNGSQLTGTPTGSTGGFSFSVTVTDSLNEKATNNYTLTVEPAITVSTGSLPTGTVNNAYSAQFSASGGAGGTFNFSTSSPLDGLTLSSNGLLNGLPVAAGSFPITVTATDSKGATGAQTFTLTVDSQPTVSPASLPVAEVGSPYSVVLSGSGGSGTGYTFSVSGQPLWLTLQGNHLTGTPTTNTGSPFSFQVSVTDSMGGTGSRSYSLTVDPMLGFTPSTLPATAENDPYYVPFSASGGSGAGYTFSLSGNVPAGLGFSGSVLTGAAAATPGTYSFTVTLADSAGGRLSRNYSLAVTAPVQVGQVGLPAGTEYQPYSATVSASGGSGGFIFSESGPLPSGISFNPTSASFSGTPTQSGTFSIRISVTDGKGGTASQSFSLVVNYSLGTSPNDLYVDSVYEELLHRSPDPSAAAWAKALGSGTSPSTLVLAIETSTEYLSNVVAAIYEHYLGRAPDPNYGAWVNAIAAGSLTIEQATAAIMSSPEYFIHKGGTNTGLATGLYEDVLGRAPDPAGLSAWVAYLNNGGSQYQAALGYLTSAEYFADLIGGGGIWNGTYPVFPWAGYYKQFLGRPPDAAGLTSWVQAMQSGATDQQVLAAIFGSPEAYHDWS